MVLAIVEVLCSVAPYLFVAQVVHAMMDAIEALTAEKTVIMIAHRLKTVEKADCIYVVDRGRIVQSGTHEELMAEPGIYQNFIAARREAVGWKL